MADGVMGSDPLLPWVDAWAEGAKEDGFPVMVLQAWLWAAAA
jgi:hypothetical protein